MAGARTTRALTDNDLGGEALRRGFTDGLSSTSSNRMELRACIEALKFIARPMVVVNGQIVIDGGEHTGAVLTRDRTSRLTRL